MDEKQALRDLRHEFNKTGLTLLVYMILMNVTVTAAMVVEVIARFLSDLGSVGLDTALLLMLDNLAESALGNGWGYIVCCLTGYLILRLWKKKDFCRNVIWQRGKPMTAAAFFAIVCIFTSGQLVFQLLASVQEWLLNLLGMSLMESMESTAVDTDTVSMFLYVGLFAPVFEEILFRGLIMRTLMPYGKKFAILASSVMFGVFHGNLAQSPYAFGVGLVLGYVAAEYSIAWAMVLHMFNNLLLTDTLTRLLSLLPGQLGDAVFMALIILCTVAAVIVLIAKRREVGAYLKQEKMDRFCVKAFFTAPANVILIAYMAFNALLAVAMTLLQ